MDAIRRARLATVIQEELAMYIAREVKDPRVQDVVITRAEVSVDGKDAKVWVSILGDSANIDSKRIKECLEGLESAAGFLRKHLARILNLRHVPSLIFREDKGFENTLRVNELLKQIQNSPKPSDE